MKKNNLFQVISILLSVSYSILAQPFVKDTNISFPYSYPCEVAWGDYDNDSDLDLVISGLISSDSSVTIIYRNNLPDSVGFCKQTSISMEGVNNNKVAWGDCNNDGNLDIILAGINMQSEPITNIFKNNGNNTFTKLHDNTIFSSNQWVLGLEWSDFNNDGKQDVLIIGRDYSNIYINDGDGIFTSTFEINLSEKAVKFAISDYNNDGYLDLLTTSHKFVANFATKLFLNQGDESFVEHNNTSLIDIKGGGIAACDYDNDGDMDILLTGATATAYKTALFNNNGAGSFSEQPTQLKGIFDGEVSWGDYNNDGFSDLCHLGFGIDDTDSTIYRNNGDRTFTGEKRIMGPVIFVDYDNDGDLDIFDSWGFTIYRNDISISNTAPIAPDNIKSKVDQNDVLLMWNAASDGNTPSKALTYNLRVGSTPGGVDIISPMSASDGFRRIPSAGNAELDTFFILKNLAHGTYYWSVQAVDNGYMGGAFSNEQSFQIGSIGINDTKDQQLTVFPNPTENHITINFPENYSAINGKLFIYNTTGNIVLQRELSSVNNQFKINELKSGLYFINVYINGVVKRTKFIKH